MKIKLIDILKEAEHHSQQSAEKSREKIELDNPDDIVNRGYGMSKGIENPETGKITSKVVNAADFNKTIKMLYQCFDEINKYRTVSYPKVSNYSTLICKEISEIVKDVKALRDYIEVVKQGLK